MSKTIVLYHGTTQASADHMMAHGWMSNVHPKELHAGSTRHLFLTTDPGTAYWYACEKGDAVVLQVEVSIERILVDPQDGVYDSIEEELSGKVPGSFICNTQLRLSAFQIHNELAVACSI